MISIGHASELFIPSVDPLHCKCIFVKVILHLNKCITIGSIYRLTSSPVESFNFLISTITFLFLVKMKLYYSVILTKIG